LLLATNFDGNTAGHMAVKRGKLAVLQKIWELAKENLTTEEIKSKLLLATDSDGNTTLHLAAEGSNLDVLQKIWDLAKENLTTEEIKSKLLLATDSDFALGSRGWQTRHITENMGVG
jgi:ankyrin repeat protein